MDGTVPPSTRTHSLADRELAAVCLAGKLDAGVELCDRFAAYGRDVTIRGLVALAVPTLRITAHGFDHLCDALDMWRALRDQEDSPP